jgi:hypothetical protein
MRGDTTDREERIRELARRMWEEAGQPEGQDDAAHVIRGVPRR